MIAGVTAAGALVLVLLRFAIDLLGLVLVLVLVGFSIRALSDWLSDDDTVSGWSLVAVVLSLCGTIAIGTWLFDVKHIDPSGAIQRRLPTSITRTIDWAERRGWGRRVLLSDRSLLRTVPPAAPQPASRTAPSLAVEIPAPAPARPTSSRPRPRGAASMAAAPALAGSAIAERSRAVTGRTAEAAPLPATGAATTPAGAGRTTPGNDGAQQGVVTSGAAEAAAAPAPTRTVLTSWPAAAVVGTSVRLTARVESDTGPLPKGTVAFRLGDRVLGTARLRPDGDASSGFVIVLDLPVGEHVIVADYGGDEFHAPSRSASVRQPVVRR